MGLMNELPLPLPRSQAGPNPQHLLVTIFGDYWSGNSVPIPSAGLVRMLGELGISAASARSAVLRLRSRGVLIATKSGRNTLYRLSESVERVGYRNFSNQFSFASEKLSNWDGRWRVVCFTISEERRQVRSALRSTLRSHGFAAVQDGVWFSAYQFTPALLSALEEFQEPSVIALDADLAYPSALGSRVQSAQSDLSGLGEAYRSFLDTYTPMLDAARSSTVSPAEAFITRTTMMDEWRGLYRRDPRMPMQLLPEDWPLEHAGRVFTELYDRLGPIAELRARDLLAEFDLEADALPRVYDSRSARTRSAEPTRAKI